MNVTVLKGDKANSVEKPEERIATTEPEKYDPELKIKDLSQPRLLLFLLAITM